MLALGAAILMVVLTEVDVSHTPDAILRMIRPPPAPLPRAPLRQALPLLVLPLLAVPQRHQPLLRARQLRLRLRLRPLSLHLATMMARNMIVSLLEVRYL